MSELRAKIFPPRDICPHCGKPASKKFEFSGKGTVYTSTVIYEAPAGFEKYVPYQEAIIQLEEGPRMTARLTDLADPTKRVEIGTEVEMVTREMKQDGEFGVIQYGPLFREPIKKSS